MLVPFLILCLQTIVCWLLVVFFHQKKGRFTIVPLYAYLAVLTLLTQNFTDLGFSITYNQWFFLIPSFSFFTTIIFTILYLYLFEGSRATRLGLYTILTTSVFYIAVVFLLGLETDTTKWVQLNSYRSLHYFWSNIAVILDVVLMAMIWEMLAKIKSLRLIYRVFITILSVLFLDSFVFVTGVFFNSEIYLSVLKGGLLVRFFLSLAGAPVLTYFLKLENFTEEGRVKPDKVWAIIDFNARLESKINTLEEALKQYKDTKEKLSEAEETYRLVIDGIGAGIWDWNVTTNKIIWSPKFYSLLGYNQNELKGTLDSLKNIMHPEDTNKTFESIEKSFKEHIPMELETRLKSKTGEYRWFLASGTVKYDAKGKPVRVVGSVVDISKRKEIESSLKEKLNELTEMNQLMVNRELKMIELKTEIANLKNK